MKVTSLSALRLYQPGDTRGTQFCYRAIVRTEVMSRRKFPMNPSGIEPATFRLIEQWQANWITVQI